MARLISTTLAALFFSISFVTSSLAQSASPEATVDDFVKAWNTHDGKAFDRLFTDDAIFVSVAEVRDEGLASVVRGFHAIHSTTGWAKNTTLLPSAIKIQTLRPDVAVVLFHVSLAGRLDDQGKRMPDVDRATLFVTVKQTDGWRVAVGQVTKQSPPRSPKIVDQNNSDKLNHNEIEQTLLKLENDWGQVDVTNDRSVFQRIIAPDFVSTSRSGKFLGNRLEWVTDWEYEGVKTAVNSDMKVHIYADNVAVVTGIDTTTGIDKEGKKWLHQDRFTDTWVKRNGVWQCAAAQVNRIK